ncbi:MULTISPECIES: type IV pilus biogenesis protein PilP [Enterobacteriaceae]|jgi:type IV pilus biogenesis protein PilP|uniref:Type IV pilus biogenesis protein PilP n=1 Tax=Enterobacter cloacae subsp. cloacae (strain ATCC 13047 / DSM 30054 / NBRC 13535 / NCTC 10005 / WDCM 00083 / NCDC 279-56) TaxID=716541 RepID=A0A0H3CED7_ENTCC|nr:MULTISPECIES: type IV pilus biogenesis protein PilP [Enterobacteriaceae]AUU88892.1 type IV pilus biogenesis protein PilP [Enterobacteriaceae bacterium ENNIH3]AUV05817.1 type IV pilus biogenesis protein PilP [Enterobacteriaceae bacterium ENNIH2]ELD7985015.1 type IV pilus biogenesis protein PilP [Enterobacter hormaechei]MDU4298387.1 type IV pilus biogenesis protein PilP [Enterobacter asburiae]HBM3127718.1 type IV pilus biogenesis protein PilP [Klebsiella michiganensis]HCD7316704.1 type IV pi
MRRINPARTGLLLSVLLSGPALSATTADALPPNVTLGELEATQARNLILEQKVQTARLEQQLRESQSGQSTDRNYLATSLQPSAPLMTQPVPSQTAATSGTEKRAGSVRLQEIYGRGTQLRARIVLPDGGVTEVAKGDQIPGTAKRVTEVTSTLVRLSDNSELSF